MDIESKKTLTKIFLLPVAGFSLFICLAFYFAWVGLQEKQQNENTFQNLQQLELSLVQVKESFLSGEFEKAMVPLNFCEFFLDKTEEGLQKPMNHHDQLQGHLLHLRNTQQGLVAIIATGESVNKNLVTGQLRIIESLLEGNMELSKNFQKASEVNMEGAKIAFFNVYAAFIALLLFLLIQFRRYIYLPLTTLEGQTNALLAGENQKVISFSENPLFINISQKMRLHQEHINQLAQLTEEIGEGNFSQQNSEFEVAGAIGKSIGRMRGKIQASFQNEEKRRWVNEGVARFSQLVREHHQEMDLLCSQTLTQLVPYVGANQGGLFIASPQNDEGIVLQLKAAYAWGRQKHLHKSIGLGEGLIGQVALDMEMVLLTDVPDDYISIGSGLGKAKPGCILLLPLVAGEQLHGVLELASFKVFEDHQIEFLRKLCEIMASSIAMAHGNTTTMLLLHKAEEANAQLSAQEEELRQNTEELMSTQEAMLRKEAELERFQEELQEKLSVATIEMERQIREIESEKIRNEAILEGCVDGVISFNVEGGIEYFNAAAEEIWEINREEAMKKKIRDFIPVEILVVDDELLVYYAKNGGRKLLDARTEVPVMGRSGQEMEVLLTLTRVKVEGAYTFTAFAQKVAVELF